MESKWESDASIVLQAAFGSGRVRAPRSPRVGSLLLAVLVLDGAVISRAASLTPLGNLPGGGSSNAHAVSADGRVIVGKADSPLFPDGEAFRWTQSEGMVGLGDLPGAGDHSWAFAVSADGGVIAGYGLSTNTLIEAEAFRWTSAGGMVRLSEPLPPQTYASQANGMSADGGIVVGFIDIIGMPGRREAFRWSATSGLTGMGDLAGGTFASESWAVSADGGVVVGEGRTENGTEAFRWTAASGMVGLGHLFTAPGQLSSSVAADVSSDGNVVVGSSESATGTQAFRWSLSEGMVGLGHLGGGESSSYATGVSADGGTIVGETFHTEGQSATIWTGARGLRRLWDVLVSQGVNPADDGWSNLTYATDVSDDGRVVVGTGQRNGSENAFIADLAPRLALLPAADGFELTWPTESKLQRATSIDPVLWEDVPGSVSPMIVVPGGSGEFFRLVDAL